MGLKKQNSQQKSMNRANLVEDLDQYGIIERHEVFARYHNSVMGNLGVERTLKVMSFGGHSWAGMRQNVKKWDWRVWDMSEDQVSTITRLGRSSGASSVFSIFSYFPICRYARSIETR